MQLLTNAIAKALHEKDQQSLQARETDTEHELIQTVTVKYFCPWGAATWWIVSGTFLNEKGDPTDDLDNYSDVHLFGRCSLFGDKGEIGYVLLSELQSAKGPGGMSIERDLHFDTTKTLDTCYE